MIIRWWMALKIELLEYGLGSWEVGSNSNSYIVVSDPLIPSGCHDLHDQFFLWRGLGVFYLVAVDSGKVLSGGNVDETDLRFVAGFLLRSSSPLLRGSVSNAWEGSKVRRRCGFVAYMSLLLVFSRNRTWSWWGLTCFRVWKSRKVCFCGKILHINVGC